DRAPTRQARADQQAEHRMSALLRAVRAHQCGVRLAGGRRAGAARRGGRLHEHHERLELCAALEPPREVREVLPSAVALTVPPTQLPLPLRLEDHAAFATLVAGPNATAVAHVRALSA